MNQFKIRVKDGHLIAGHAQDGARLKVMPGEYVAFWLDRAEEQDSTQRTALRLLDADTRDGDLYVLRDEFPDDLDGFPALSPNSMFEIMVE